MPTFPQLSFSQTGNRLQLHVRRPELGGTTTANRFDDEANFVPPKGEMFDALLAMSTSDLQQIASSVAGQLGALSRQSPTVRGNEITMHLEDGFFISAEEVAQSVCKALGLPIDPANADPRIPRDRFVIEVGNSRIRFDMDKRRTPSLLSIARQAAAGELKQDDPVAAGEASLHDTAGKMGIRRRGLPVHIRDFPGLLERLESYDDTKQILVTGAGEAAIARDLYFGCDRPLRIDEMGRIDALVRRSDDQKPRIVAVDLVEPPVKHDNFRAETGLYADIDSDRLVGGGPLFSDVIDMMGAVTYSPTLSSDLQKSLDLLEEGGVLWIGTSDSVVIYDDDRLMFLPEWLRTIDGLEVDCRELSPTNGTYFQFKVTKTKKDVSVEALDLLYRQDQYPRAVSTIQIFRPASTT